MTETHFYGAIYGRRILVRILIYWFRMFDIDKLKDLFIPHIDILDIAISNNYI